MLAHNVLRNHERGHSYIRSENIEVLTHIYDEHINLAAWKKPCNTAAKSYAQFYLSHHSSTQLQGALSNQHARAWLNDKLPDHISKQAFIEDLTEVIEMFAYLFDLTSVGLRLTPLTKSMCPRLHVDKVQCRLVTTYAGVGTEWLDDNIGYRSQLKLGSTPTEPPSELIHSLDEQEVGLLKGTRWDESDTTGVIHRSPQAAQENPRLLLTLDILN
ncbi:DUF1826 domain-containing protein [Litoribrevibacter euphylliae]|uniref:DUF1826 domain-containing protein n=1 Tax=Litoribrevibacter euphylliae TaxID=1834034 RepID=A0ABV7HE62_9GAMM